MKMSKEKIIREANRYLKRTDQFQERRRDGYPDEENYQIMVILKRAEDVIIYAALLDDDVVLCLRPFINVVAIDPFYDHGDIFEYLEKGYKIVDMNLFSHHCIWQLLNERHDEARCVNGMQKYLAYCKQNGITREFLVEKESYEGMNVMKLLETPEAP